jgi:cytochrome c556
MKKIIALIAVSILSTAAFSFADHHKGAEAPKKELRPLQVLMQARAAWMKAMNENLAAMKFEAVSKDADSLSAQTKKVGEGAANPIAKEINLKISGLAAEVSAAAAKKDGAAVKAKLGEIKANCSECHAKVRDKK